MHARRASNKALAAPRSGLTVLELLVAVAVIGSLVGLLVPAVQKARAAASQLQCMNNLRQLGIACHAFHDAKGGFPAAHWELPNSDNVTASWVPYLFPYIDQEAAFKAYNFQVEWKDPVNEEVSKTVIPLLLCPATPPVEGRRGRGRTDYAATSAIDRSNPFLQRPVLKVDHTLAGALGRNLYRSLNDIRDGASTTMLLAEDAAQPEQWVLGELLGVEGIAGSWAYPYNRLILSGFNTVTLSNPGPCAVNCYNNGDIYGFHPAGANVLFVDGSVHLLHAGTDINVTVALLTRSGGEAIPDHAYE